MHLMLVSCSIISHLKQKQVIKVKNKHTVHGDAKPPTIYMYEMVKSPVVVNGAA
jgi:hypothetical protein